MIRHPYHPLYDAPKRGYQRSRSNRAWLGVSLWLLASAVAIIVTTPAKAEGIRYIGTDSAEEMAAAKARKVFAAIEADAAASNRLLFVWYNGRVDVVAFPDGAACASARTSLLETTREKWGQPPVMLCVR